jgi:hypothetical protein
MLLSETIFVQRLHFIWKKYGISIFVKYLKVSLYAVYSFIGGKPLRDTTPLGVSVAMRNGLPYIIPAYLRKRIRRGDVAIIHIVVTILNSYKALQDKHVITPGECPATIVAEEWSCPPEKILEWMKFLETSNIQSYSWNISKYNRPIHPIIMSAGPNGSIASLSQLADAQALENDPEQRMYLLDYINYTNAWSFSEDLLEELYLEAKKPVYKGFNLKYTSSAVDNEAHFNELWTKVEQEHYQLFGLFLEPVELHTKEMKKALHDTIFAKALNIYLGTSPRLGRLAIKLEAAGKVRIFAMLDSITQGALKPLHDMIFDYLKLLPSDATFDQEGTLEKFMAINKGKRFWSFDLSSATDMIPKQLYLPVLRKLIGVEAASAWMGLFSRPFEMPKQYWTSAFIPYWVKYTRGQPMGAYSSWAMLALVHHLLVSFANWRLGNGARMPYGKYLVLGDDITISDPDLALAYQKVCEDFEIPIGILKSHTDSNICNFANQVYQTTGENISPISLSEIFQAHTLSSRLEFGRRLQRRGYIGEGYQDLFRSFFSPESWLNETKYLTKGTLSSYGGKVVSSLVLPNGRTSATAVNAIKGLFPNCKTLSHPSLQVNLDWQKTILNLPVSKYHQWADKESLILRRLIPQLLDKIGEFFDSSQAMLNTAFGKFGASKFFRQGSGIDGYDQGYFPTYLSLFYPFGNSDSTDYNIDYLQGERDMTMSTDPTPDEAIIRPAMTQKVKGKLITIPELRILNRSSVRVVLDAFIEQALAIRRYRVDYIKLGYDDQNVFSELKYYNDLIHFAYHLVPPFDPTNYNGWKETCKISRTKAANAWDTSNKFIRDIRRLANAIGYPPNVVQERTSGYGNVNSFNKKRFVPKRKRRIRASP